MWLSTELPHIKTWQISKELRTKRLALAECKKRMKTDRPGLSRLLVDYLPEEIAMLENELKRRRDAAKRAAYLTKETGI